MGLKVIQVEIKLKIIPAREQIHRAELIQDRAVLQLLHNHGLSTEILRIVQHRVMRSQNQVLLTTSHTGRVQLITEVQVQEVLHDLTVPQHQVQATTEAVHLYAAAAEVVETTVAAAVVAEAAEVLIPAVLPVEVLQEVVEVGQAAVALLLQVEDNFRKHNN